MYIYIYLYVYIYIYIYIYIYMCMYIYIYVYSSILHTQLSTWTTVLCKRCLSNVTIIRLNVDLHYTMTSCVLSVSRNSYLVSNVQCVPTAGGGVDE